MRTIDKQSLNGLRADHMGKHSAPVALHHTTEQK